MDLSEVVESNTRRHPWETARAGALRSILASHGVRHASSLLDYGCGDGFTGRVLADALGARRLVGIDSALPVAERSEPLARGGTQITLRELAPVAAERFALVLLLDVLEHVDDDVGLLRGLVERNAAAHGAVLLTVPAGPRLFGPHDEALGHRRRYRRSQIVQVARAAGLDVIASGNLFASLFVARALERVAESALPRLAERPRGAGRWQRGPVATRFVETALVIESRAMTWLDRRNAPTVGLSAWVMSRPS
jgi:SAM-dependent methyltransferase